MNTYGTQVECKVSIIVPVYNVALYLRRCVESLINQTLREIEIILIDDGSTDGSGDICDYYAGLDSRIRVKHKANEGLSFARNYGIDMATAPYIMFVDSDDWVEPEFCELPYRKAVDNSADLILFAFNTINQEGSISETRPNIDSGLLCETDALRFTVQFAPAIWLGLYSRTLFNEVRFPVGKYHEDTGTTYKLIHAARRIWLLDDALYNYRTGRKGSIITTTETRDHPDRKEMLLTRINDLCSWGYEPLVWNDALYLLTRFGCYGEEQKPLAKIVSEIKGYPLNFNLKRKVLLTLYRISPILFDVICIMMGRQQTKKRSYEQK